MQTTEAERERLREERLIDKALRLAARANEDDDDEDGWEGVHNFADEDDDDDDEDDEGDNEQDEGEDDDRDDVMVIETALKTGGSPSKAATTKQRQLQRMIISSDAM